MTGLVERNCTNCGVSNPFMYPCHQQGCPHQHPESGERYSPLADCPACFESCGYLGDHSRGYDGADCFTPNPLRPCPECNGTGKVECQPRTLEDLESEAQE